MKSGILLVIATVLSMQLAFSQETTDTIKFADVEVKPIFPGGDPALMKFVADNCKYPEEAKNAGIEGRVFIQFIINTDGQVTNATIAKGTDPDLDAEALRVVNLIPDWIPGMQDGKHVNVSFIIPINFRFYRDGFSSGGGLLGVWKVKRKKKKEQKANKRGK